jgi:hypothetical protein
VTQPNHRTTSRNVGTEAARGQQQTAGQQDMRKDGSRLVAQSRLTAEQEKHNLRRQPPTGRQETEDNEDPMETSEDNGSDSTYCGSTDSMKVR